ncbi:hypothetical protein [Nonomuraea cavernae]|nr:hypothetical protein [Nonomuraea cavernae]
MLAAVVLGTTSTAALAALVAEQEMPGHYGAGMYAELDVTA